LTTHGKRQLSERVSAEERAETHAVLMDAPFIKDRSSQYASYLRLVVRLSHCSG
jgi:hypothetical protein